MATTNIELDIEKVTGLVDADDQLIVSAQKAVASSIPKEILRWAASETVSGTHGGDDSPTAITLPVGTDNIIAVRRDANDAKEATLEDRAWLEASSGSLKVPTESFPKYYITAGNQVRVKPDPTASKTAHVTYVDYSKIDDTSDLRSAVFYKAAASEFMYLSTKLSGESNISTQTPPAPPSAPSFTYTDASVGDITGPVVAISDMATLSASAPTYVPPVMSSPDFADANTWVNTEEDSEMSASRVQVIQSQIGDFSARVQDALNSFNEDNVAYQEDIQRKIQNLNKDTQEAVQQLQSDLSVKSANLSKDQQVNLQNAVQNFQQDVQEYSSKLQLYSNELSSYQNKISEEAQGKQIKLQRSQGYLAQSDKYYNWYLMEIKQYIESNSNMINKSMAMQAMSGRRQAMSGRR